MVGEDEYELLPHEEIQKLRDELNKLKKNPLGSTAAAKDLQTSISDLTEAINSLTTLLTQTNDDMTREFSRSSITEQFSAISSQNEQIAQGILAVAQIVEKATTPSENSTPQNQEPSQAQSEYAPQQNQYSQNNFGQSAPSNMNPDPFAQPAANSTYGAPAPGMMPPSTQSSPDQFSSPPPMGGSTPPPPLNLPPAPEKKKGGLMGMFK